MLILPGGAPGKTGCAGAADTWTGAGEADTSAEPGAAGASGGGEYGNEATGVGLSGLTASLRLHDAVQSLQVDFRPKIE